MPCAGKLSSSACRAKCGLRREPGKRRTSATRAHAAPFTQPHQLIERARRMPDREQRPHTYVLAIVAAARKHALRARECHETPD
jgi:hypothetical protein